MEKRKLKTIAWCSILMVTLGGCMDAASQGAGTYSSDAFKKYWYAGKAELSTYNLSQSRYGENREGKAVLIFVSEDFSKRKQVKLDDPASAGADKVNVLKLNFTKNFITGIYPYTMMLSVFTPVARNESTHSVKATMTSQEWCGQVFSQLNERADGYEVKSYSYFEQEGDQTMKLPKLLLEDELWNTIRLDHKSLPEGEVEIIPGLFFTRLGHTALKPLLARVEKKESADRFTYTITFSGGNRTLSIHFEKRFPFQILGWDETFKERNVLQHTSATLDKTLRTDYWTKNGKEFEYLRDTLNLPAPR